MWSWTVKSRRIHADNCSSGCRNWRGACACTAELNHLRLALRSMTRLTSCHLGLQHPCLSNHAFQWVMSLKTTSSRYIWICNLTIRSQFCITSMEFSAPQQIRSQFSNKLRCFFNQQLTEKTCVFSPMGKLAQEKLIRWKARIVHYSSTQKWSWLRCVEYCRALHVSCCLRSKDWTRF